MKTPSHFFSQLKSAVIPLFLLLVFGAAFGISSYYMDKPPKITEVVPDVALPGEYITVMGENFGEAREGSQISIAGERPLIADYKLWSDTKVQVRVPLGVSSGLVTVNTSVGSSNGVMFTNREILPVVVEGPSKPGFPYIEEISPDSGSVSDLIVISGKNFGLEQGESHDVYFASTIPGNDSTRVIGQQIDFDYELWTDQEIHIRVPSGAGTGNISVMTPAGESNASFFEVINPSGDIQYTNRHGFQLNYGVTLDQVKAEGENMLDLWVPRAEQNLAQNIVDQQEAPAPFWEDYRGVMRFRFENLESFRTYNVDINIWIERSEIITRIFPAKVPSTYNTDSQLYKEYTSPADTMPSGEQRWINLAATASGGYRNPYFAARQIFNYLLARVNFTNAKEGDDLYAVYQSGAADAYSFARIYCTLLRARGIPARPVAGFLVASGGLVQRHLWAEVFIPGLGWMPVDPAVAKAPGLTGYAGEMLPEEFYFGNLDSQHVAFSRGFVELTHQYPDSRLVKRNDLYGLQSFFEEISGGISSYKGTWRDIMVVEAW